MKIRTDFVTNSSSSSFVTVTVKLSNGKSLQLQEDFDAGMDTYIPDNAYSQELLTRALDKVSNGAELMNVLNEHVQYFQNCFIEPSENGHEFRDALDAVSSVAQLKSLTLKEDKKYEDEIKTHKFRYSYDFHIADKEWSYKKLKNGTIMITGYNGNARDLVVPAEIDGKVVSELGDYSLTWRAKDDQKAYDRAILLYNIRSVTLPDSIVSIGDNAFFLCKRLEKVNIPAQIKKIGKEAFSHCYNLESVTIPDGIENIGQDAFDMCNRLTVFVESDQAIFNNQLSCVKKIVSPKIDIADMSDGRVKLAAARGFLSDIALFSKSEYYDSYKDYVMNNRDALIPEFIVDDDCERLSFIIENSAVDYSEIEKYFIAADKFHSDKCAEYLAGVKNKNGWNAAGADESVDPFSVEEMKKLWAYKMLPDKTLAITNYKGTDSIVIVPGRIGKKIVSRIDDYVFSLFTRNADKPHARKDAMRKIAIMILPDSITSIGRNAFQFCNFLAINIADCQIDELEESVFSYCDKIRNIVLPDSLTKIGRSAFKHCGSLTNIKIPDGVTVIGSSAFEECSQLENINIPDKVTQIQVAAFENCENFSVFSIPDGVTEIGFRAFRQCVNLTKISIPDSVKEIADQVFECCGNLVIHAPAGSYAESYAKEHDIKFCAE